MGNLSGHGRGGGCDWANLACRIPSSPAISRNQRWVKPSHETSVKSSEAKMPDSPETAARHAEKKAKVKAARDRMMVEKTVEKGLLLVLTGPGKGKSSSAFGMILRAISHGMPCAVVQFIKGAMATGERDLLLSCFGDICQFYTMGEGFTWETQDLLRDKAAASAAWEKAKTLIRDPSIRMVLLDEICIALRYEYLDVNEVVGFLRDEKPPMTHVILTGRNAPPALIEIADLVTEMAVVKHPFRSGVKAQAGIEF